MVILVVRLEVEKTKENYQAVVDALAEYDVASVGWETDSKPAPKSGQTGSDLGTNLSEAINRVRSGQGG